MSARAARLRQGRAAFSPGFFRTAAATRCRNSHSRSHQGQRRRNMQVQHGGATCKCNMQAQAAEHPQARSRIMVPTWRPMWRERLSEAHPQALSRNMVARVQRLVCSARTQRLVCSPAHNARTQRPQATHAAERPTPHILPAGAFEVILLI